MELELSPIRQPKKVKATVETPNEETPEKEIDLGFQVDRNKVYIFETIKKSEHPRNENLGSICKVFDTAQKRYRDIRYLPTAPSIFVEEWDDSFKELPEPPLGFYRNQLVAPGEDIRLMEYLMSHRLYEFSPFRVTNVPAYFTLVDKDVQEEIKAKRHAVELKALEAIKDTPIEDLRPIARIIFGITETSDTSIINRMNELVKIPKKGSEAQSNAERVLDNISNPRLIRQYNVQTGFDRGIIVADINKMEVRFVDGNVFVMRLDSKDYLKCVTDWTFTSDGAKWYTILKNKV